jgi:16S rRNA (guanine966-N2)-methyltransferase
MRIIGGYLKGRKVAVPKKFKSRPTTDFARESLFNILQNRYDLDEMTVVDLFAGTGAISYEFVSRGAKHVVSIEQHHLNVKFIQKSFDELGIENAAVYRANVFDWAGKTDQRYDIVFADPPFKHPGLAELPGLVRESNLVLPGGVFILEHPDQHSFSQETGFLEHRRYGGVNFSLFTDFR